jgi:hypothetical protein
MEHSSNSNLTREERRMELERISRSKNGMLELHRLRQVALVNKAKSMPVARANDSLERMIHDILGHEFPQEQVE